MPAGRKASGGQDSSEADAEPFLQRHGLESSDSPRATNLGTAAPFPMDMPNRTNAMRALFALAF